MKSALIQVQEDCEAKSAGEIEELVQICAALE